MQAAAGRAAKVHAEEPARRRRQLMVPHPSIASSIITMESIRPALASLRLAAPRRVSRPLYQCLHTTAVRRATPLPHPSVPGPPPETPTPSASDALHRVARKRKQAELLKQAKDIRTPNKSNSGLAKRFWKSVTVKETDGTAFH